MLFRVQAKIAQVIHYTNTPLHNTQIDLYIYNIIGSNVGKCDSLMALGPITQETITQVLASTDISTSFCLL